MKTRAASGKGPSQRQLRAGEVVRHALVEVLKREDLREPGLRGVSVTVSEVRISPDLKQASVFCAPLGGKVAEKSTRDVAMALNRAAPHIRGLLARRVDLKYTPALVFLADESFSEAARIDALLASPEVRRDLSARPPCGADDPDREG